MDFFAAGGTADAALNVQIVMLQSLANALARHIAERYLAPGVAN